MRLPPLCLLPAACCLLLAGCVEQTMDIQSDPPGALVSLNNQELGRTPLTRDFKWYGDYDVQVRLEGYETLKTHQKVIAPAWNWVPFDLFAQLLPMTFTDHRTLNYALKPLDPAKDEPIGLLSRAEDLKSQLDQSPFTRVPAPRTTQPATRPTTRPAK
jgi:hypothetical protein